MKKILLMVGMSAVFSFLVLQVVVPIQVWAVPTLDFNSQWIPSGQTGGGSVVEQTGSDSVTNQSDTSGLCGGKICNPIQADSIQELIFEALEFVVNLLAIAGVLYIMWTGFLFVKAQGNPDELEKAKKSFFNAIIGMAIILGAWAIATVVANTINKITNNNDVVLRPQ